MFIHYTCATTLFTVNFLLVPYLLLLGSAPYYVLTLTDFRRAWGILKNILGRGEYPAFSIYNVDEKRYENKFHPLMKLLFIAESIAMVSVVFTGLYLYNSQFEVFGVQVSQYVFYSAKQLSPILHPSAEAIIRSLHLAVWYFFVLDIIFRVGVLSLDPKMKKFIRSIFFDGKDDTSDRSYSMNVGKKR
jgi:cytochrome b subunit of formate dehydrogenase